MTFEPPHCPFAGCPAFTKPPSRFPRWGTFRVQSRTEPERRYRCPSCRRTFSRQTFRQDYRDRRPETNVRLFQLLTSGVGLRQSARLLDLSCSGVQHKMRKMAATCAALHRNLSRSLPPGRAYVLDEAAGHQASSQGSVSMPIVIERDSRFIVATGVAPARKAAPKGTGLRSRPCVAGALRELAEKREGPLELHTNRKASYAELCREVFRGDATHTTTSGSQARNPLLQLRATVAMLRDSCARLRPDSWLGSRALPLLKAQLDIFAVYRNYVRQRSNRDDAMRAPACFLGLLPRRLHPDEVLRWRQDWGARSIHPISRSGMRLVS